MATTKKVVWSFKGLEMLSDISTYLSENVSNEFADNYIDALIKKVDELPPHPERYPPCRVEKLRKAGFRCFTVKQHVVVYEVEHDITILAIIHSRRNPKFFENIL